MASIYRMGLYLSRQLTLSLFLLAILYIDQFAVSACVWVSYHITQCKQTFSTTCNIMNMECINQAAVIKMILSLLSSFTLLKVIYVPKVRWVDTFYFLFSLNFDVGIGCYDLMSWLCSTLYYVSPLTKLLVELGQRWHG